MINMPFFIDSHGIFYINLYKPQDYHKKAGRK